MSKETQRPRRFAVTLVSTKGHGVLWPDNTVTIKWQGEAPSVVMLDSPEQLRTMLGDGADIDWLDPDPITTTLRRAMDASRRRELVDLRDRVERALEALDKYRSRRAHIEPCVCAVCLSVRLLRGDDQ